MTSRISHWISPYGILPPKNVVVINGCGNVGAIVADVLAQNGVNVYTTDSAPERADIPGYMNISPGANPALIRADWCSQFTGQPRVLHAYAWGHVWTTFRRGPVQVHVHGDVAAYSPRSEPMWSIPAQLRDALREEANGDVDCQACDAVDY